MSKGLIKSLALLVSALALEVRANFVDPQPSNFKMNANSLLDGLISFMLDNPNVERVKKEAGIEEFVLYGRMQGKLYRLAINFRNNEPHYISYSGPIGDGRDKEVTFIDSLEDGFGLSEKDIYVEHFLDEKRRKGDWPNTVYRFILQSIYNEHNLYK